MNNTHTAYRRIALMMFVWGIIIGYWAEYQGAPWYVPIILFTAAAAIGEAALFLSEKREP